MKTKPIKTSLDKPFDHELVENADFFALVAAIKFKLTIRALYREGCENPPLLPPRPFVESILKNDPFAIGIANAIHSHLNPETPAPKFFGAPYSGNFISFAVENLTAPQCSAGFNRKVRMLIECGTFGVTPSMVMDEVSRRHVRGPMFADPWFYAVYWMLENPGYGHVFDLSETVDAHRPCAGAYEMDFLMMKEIGEVPEELT